MRGFDGEPSFFLSRVGPGDRLPAPERPAVYPHTVMIRRALRTSVLSLLAAAGTLPALAAGEAPDVHAAAGAVGRALTGGGASALRLVLPDAGKVQLSLIELGPETGSFGPAQVEAWVRDFLARGSARDWNVERAGSDGRSQAFAQASLSVSGASGRLARVKLSMSFQLEAGRWVLRGLKEARE